MPARELRDQSCPAHSAKTTPMADACSGEQRAFRDQQPRELPARRSERQPHADFVAPRRPARQLHVRDVGGRDEEHHQDHREDGGERPLEALAQRRRAAARAAAGRRKGQRCLQCSAGGSSGAESSIEAPAAELEALQPTTPRV
mgnify:CR=1 FL=1